MGDIEIIVGDSNGCFDFYPDPRVREVNTEGLHMGDAINLMISEAKSDIILHLSDDDIDLPNRAQFVYDNMDGVDLFAASYVRMNRECKLLDDAIVEPWDYEKFLKLEFNFPILSGGYRKSTCPRWSNKLLYYGDVAFIIECARKGLVIKTSPEVVTKMRIHGDQISSGDVVRDRARKEERIRFCAEWGIHDYLTGK
jgi:hypothetical protein